MRRMILCLFYLAWVLPCSARPQEPGEISVFGGYSGSWEILDPLKHGWNASISGNITKSWALFADVSGHSAKSGSYEYHTYNLMFGPRYVRRIGNRWTPFAHALFGLYKRDQNSLGSSVSYAESTSRNLFALGGGGGIDISINGRLSLRMLQIDVVRSSNGHWGFGRISTGAVIRLAGAPKQSSVPVP